jgi:hypothetical protein
MSLQNNAGGFQPWARRNPFEVNDFATTRNFGAPALTGLNADEGRDMVVGWAGGTLYAAAHGGDLLSTAPAIGDQDGDGVVGVIGQTGSTGAPRRPARNGECRGATRGATCQTAAL